jgi:hypothetical protein
MHYGTLLKAKKSPFPTSPEAALAKFVKNDYNTSSDFLCSCPFCSLPDEQSKQSDKRLARIDQLGDLIGRDGMALKFSLRTLRYADECVRLYNEQGPGDSRLARTYMDAAQVTIAKGDLARGRIFAERAVEGWRASGGDDCKEVLEHGDLCKNPATFSLYGRSMAWQTTIEEVPQGLDPNEFEDWLWRRETQANRDLVQCSTGFRDRDFSEFRRPAKTWRLSKRSCLCTPTVKKLVLFGRDS